jgi:hypothetical protein
MSPIQKQAYDDLIIVAKMAKAYFDNKTDGRGTEDPIWGCARKALASVARAEDEQFDLKCRLAD